MRNINKQLIICLFLLTIGSICNAEEKRYEQKLNNGVIAIFITKPFEREKHKIEWCKENKKIPCKIDGKVPHGNLFYVPTTEVSSLTIVIHNKQIKCDTSAMYDAYLDGFLKYHKKSNSLSSGYITPDQYRIRAVLGAEAGSYAVEYKLNNTRCVRTLLSSSEEDVFSMFDKLDDENRITSQPSGR